MLFAEEHARWLLVLHTGLAVALVGSATHLVIWMRGFARGRFTRMAAIRRFSLITLLLFVATFLVGNAVYPVYKVRVKVEYLENSSAIRDDLASRGQAKSDIARRWETQQGRAAPAPVANEPPIVPRQTAKIARWFDVKEHWVALGMALSLGCWLLLRLWDPKRDGPHIANFALAFAIGAAFTVWLGAIIGVLTTSYRAVGNLG